MNLATNHEQAFELLPWLINGTLSGVERSALEAHVQSCIACRAELKQQTALSSLVKQQSGVHLSPDAGFDELMRRIDAPATQPASVATRITVPARALRPTWGAVAAAIVIVVAGILATLSGTDMAGTDTEFSTLTDPVTGQSARIDVIFSAGITENEMRRAVIEVGGTIVAGPSAIGRYTIDIDGVSEDAALEDLIGRLSRDERVRFAARSFIATDGR